MKNKEYTGYVPPFTVSPEAISLIAGISAQIERYAMRLEQVDGLRLRKANRIKTIRSSLAIEGNMLSENQVCDILDGKNVVAPAKEIQEVRNAIRTYELYNRLNPFNIKDLLKAHAVMMESLIDKPGRFRNSGVGVFEGERCVHMAPPPIQVPGLMGDLFEWLKHAPDHLLVRSCVFHYEFEFIHPFADGNGRIGRLWHTAIMASWIPEMAWVPVESVVRERQSEYYSAIATSTMAADSGPFIDFMLEAIRDALDDVAKSSGTFAIALNPTEDHLLGMIRSGTYANASMAAEALSVSERTIFRALKSLKEKGLIVREGTDKTGVWRAT